MKRLILILAVCLGTLACGNNSNNGGSKCSSNSGTACCTEDSRSGKTLSENARSVQDRVEILCFHAKQRCATCLAIEKNVREVVENEFADGLKNGTVVFRTIDISEKENKEIAGKYEVTWSSLFVCRWKDGKETYENLTEYAFMNARTAPEKFRNGLAEKIREMQK